MKEGYPFANAQRPGSRGPRKPRALPGEGRRRAGVSDPGQTHVHPFLHVHFQASGLACSNYEYLLHSAGTASELTLAAAMADPLAGVTPCVPDRAAAGGRSADC